MPSETLISATIIVCESVLTEQSGVPSAIRITDILTLGSGNPIAHFFTKVLFEDGILYHLPQKSKTPSTAK